jgi:hypothetical protein
MCTQHAEAKGQDGKRFWSQRVFGMATFVFHGVLAWFVVLGLFSLGYFCRN